MANAATEDNITFLKTQLDSAGGIARGNHFEISFKTPKFQKEATQGFINATCESFSLPGRAVQVEEFGRYNRPIGVSTEDITITFILTNDFGIYKLFMNWINTVVSTDINGKIEGEAKPKIQYKDSYKADIELHHLNLNDAKNHTIKLIDAYPTSVTDIELSSSNDDYLRMTVVMTYLDYEHYDHKPEIPKLFAAAITPGANVQYTPNNISPEAMSNSSAYADRNILPTPDFDPSQYQSKLYGISSIPWDITEDIGNQVDKRVKSIKTAVTQSIQRNLENQMNTMNRRFSSTISTITSPIENSISNAVNQANAFINGTTNSLMDATLNPVMDFLGGLTTELANEVDARVNAGSTALDSATQQLINNNK
jgi:hypothetical protein